MKKIKEEIEFQQYQLIKPGDIIISSPYAEVGTIFHNAIIYILHHGENRITGVIINKLLKQLDVSNISKDLSLNYTKNFNNFLSNKLSIYFGGPVEQEKGLILHSSDYNDYSTSIIDKNISISTNTKIISDIAFNKGPSNSMFILGYSAWSNDQLISEIKQNNWVIISNTLNEHNFYDLIFMKDCHLKWSEVLKMAKIDLNHYSTILGSA